VDTNIINFEVKKMEIISHRPNFKGIFSDKRLEKRGDIICSILVRSRGNNIKGNTKNEAEQKGFYRFLDNDKVEEKSLIKELTPRCELNV
jgi:hypothetical protein